MPTVLRTSHNSYLIPQEVVSNLEVVLKFASRWGGTQFEWNAKQQKLRVTKSCWKLFKFAFVIYGWFVYLAFLLGVILCFGVKNGRLLGYHRALLLLMGGIVLAIILYVMVVNEAEICVFVNTGLRLARSIDTKFSQNRKPPPVSGIYKRFCKILEWFPNCVRFYAFTCGLLSLLKPKLNFLMTSYIPDELNHPLITLGHSVAAVCFVFGIGGAVITITSILLLSGIVFFRLQHEMNMTKKKYWMDKSFRTPDQLVTIVKSLQMFNQMLDEFTANLIYPLQTAITRSTQFANFLVIRNHEKYNVLDLALLFSYSVMFGGGWLVIMDVAGYANKYSGKVIKSFRVFSENGHFETRHERLVWRRVRKTLRPMAGKVGSFYIIKSKSSIKIGSDYVRGTLRLLMAVKRQARNGSSDL